ncbi:hypothetical protein D3C78_1857790 [compost metagenome]
MGANLLSQCLAVGFRELGPFAEVIKDMHELKSLLMKFAELGDELRVPAFDIKRG